MVHKTEQLVITTIMRNKLTNNYDYEKQTNTHILAKSSTQD